MEIQYPEPVPEVRAPEVLLTVSELARKIDEPVKLVNQVMRAGFITPAYIAGGGRFHMFLSNDLGKIAESCTIYRQGRRSAVV